MGIFIPQNVDNSTLQLVAGIMSVKDAGITSAKLAGTVGSYAETTAGGTVNQPDLSALAVVNPGATTYLSGFPGVAATAGTEANRRVRQLRARTLVGFSVRLGSTHDAAQACSIVARRNGADSVMVASIGAGAAAGSLVASEGAAVDYAVDDYFAFKAVGPAAGIGSFQPSSITAIWRNA